MKILGIDPATYTGLAWLDTDAGHPYTERVKTTNPHDASAALLRLNTFTRGVKPDYVIIEQPILPREGRSIKGYNTHVAILNYWLTALYGRWGFRAKLEEQGKIKSTTKARIVYPSTWQSKMFEGVRGSGTKVKSRNSMTMHFPGIEGVRSADECDAVNMCLYQYYLCRPLNVTDPDRARIFDAMRASGNFIAAPHEMELFR